jgi:transcriptional regulator with PAS, ATPase and Fis domain
MFLEIVQNPSNLPTMAHVMEDAYLDEIPISRQKAEPIHHGNVLPAIGQPLLINETRDIHDSILVDESLNIMDKEKELIEKALRKHKGKRKDAASDLGISERTLYRKLKEYDIED